MNYNGYGKTVEDLHVPPDDLFRAVSTYEDPFLFYSESEQLLRLRQGYHDDMEKAAVTEPEVIKGVGRIYKMPFESWPRRIAGVFSNEKAREEPELAHALVVDNGDGTRLVSVRAPLARKNGADELCRKFPTGGGRAAAAGINALPENKEEEFIHFFEEIFSP